LVGGAAAILAFGTTAVVLDAMNEVRDATNGIIDLSRGDLGRAASEFGGLKGGVLGTVIHLSIDEALGLLFHVRTSQ
jgi:hypothetical protein